MAWISANNPHISLVSFNFHRFIDGLLPKYPLHMDGLNFNLSRISSLSKQFIAWQVKGNPQPVYFSFYYN